jgi:O-antigen/teichoic acid export membrane protein
MQPALNKLLLAAQKAARTDIRYLLSGSFWLLFGQGFQMITSLVLSLVLANMLEKTAFGTYQFIMSVTAVMGAFTLTGVAISIKRAVANDAEGALRYGFRIQMLYNLGIILSGIIVGTYFLIKGNYPLGITFYIAGILISLIVSFSLYRSYLLGKKLFKETTLLGFWRKPLTLISVIVAVYFFTTDPNILALIYLLSSAISLGLMYQIVVKKYQLPVEKEGLDFISYSKHLSIIGILRMVAKNLDSILIFYHLGAASVAIYALAKLPLMHLTKVFGNIGNLAFPKFATKEYSLLKQTLPRKTLIILSLTTVTVTLYILAAPYIYKLLFPDYTESVILSQILILGLLFKSASLYERVFEAHALKNIQHITITSTLFVKIFALLLLLPVFGLWGAVSAILIEHAYWCIMATSLFFLHKDKKESVSANTNTLTNTDSAKG